MIAPSEAIFAPGTLFLVTGSNGLVGSYVVDQILNYGYRVRGTVRDKIRSEWMKEYFEQKYGVGKFELVEVKNLHEKGSLDEVMKGCGGAIHTASNVSFSLDRDVVINDAINMTMSVLESASKTPSIRKVIVTSSSAAATQLTLDEAHDLTPDSWNDTAVKLAWSGEPQPYMIYAASKTQAEKEIWKFVSEQKPHFVVNTVLPDFVCGPPLSTEQQGYPTSIGLFKMIWDGQPGEVGWYLLQGQWMIDAGDMARLHVAALIHPDAKSERIFGYGHRKTWTEWIKLLKQWYPDRKFPQPMPHESVDLSNVTARPNAEYYLKWLHGKGFKPMDESIQETIESFPKD